MHAMLAAGVFALAFVAGSLVVDFGVRRPQSPPVVHFTLRAAIGVVLLTPVLVLLAHFGAFVVPVLGAVGWLALVGRLALAYRRLRAARAAHLAFDAGEAVVAIAVVAFAVIALHGRDEPWGAGRDQQVYASFAMQMARAHADAVVTRPGDDADRELLRTIGTGHDIDHYLGIRRTVSHDGSVEARSYLPLGFSAWLAVFVAIGGLAALPLANVTLFAAGAVLFYPTLRAVSDRALAAAGAVALLALPSSLWIAGVTLSEPLAMLAWLALLAVLTRTGERARMLIAPMLFAFATIRIDALALAPLAALAVIVDAVTTADPCARRAGQHTSVSMLAAVVAAIGWYAMLDAPYLRDTLREVVAIGIVVTMLAIVSFAPVRAYAFVRALVASNVASVIVALVIALALAYAAFVRPAMQPFALIHNGFGLDGTRDFREESLRNLAVYAGWPMIVLAAAGAAVAIHRVMADRTALAFRVAVLGGLGLSALYLAAPLVSPDQPWGVRRFVPVVLPAVVMFAVIALAFALRRRHGGRALAGAGVLAALSLQPALAYGLRPLALRENQGSGTLLASVAARLPDALVVCDAPLANACGPLALAWQHPVIVADLQRGEVRRAVARWFARKAESGKPAYLLHDARTSMDGAQADCEGTWQWRRQFIAPSMRAPARDIESAVLGIALTRVGGLDAAFAERGFGNHAVWGLDDDGFYPPAPSPFGSVRMTNGHATLDVPAASLTAYRSLAFDWFSWAPWNESRSVSVTIAGHRAWQKTLPSGASHADVVLPALPSRGTVRIAVDSDAFDPRRLDANDRRTGVGIGVLGIRGVR
jgi:hypothetical protein